MILKEVEQKFLFPSLLRPWILTSIGNKWREHKCYLKAKYYNEDSTITHLLSNCPPDVVQDQWVSIVNFWRSDEGKKRSQRGRLSHAKAQNKVRHTAGSKSYARVGHEMKKRDDKSPTRTALWLETHERPSDAHLTSQIREIDGRQNETGQNLGLDDDAVAQVIGKDKSLVRGLGLGVTRSDVSSSTSRGKFKDLSITSKDESSSDYKFRKILEVVTRMDKRMKKQDHTIKKLNKTVERMKRKIEVEESEESDSESVSRSSDAEEAQGDSSLRNQDQPSEN